MNTRLPGKLSISKPTSGRKRWIEIQLTDESSGSRLVTVEVSLEHFAEAVTGLSYRPCVYEYQKDCPVGKIYEHKNETLPIPWEASDQLIDEAIGRHEIDGWVGSRGDVKNHHRRTADNAVNIGFHRYVDPPKKERE